MQAAASAHLLHRGHSHLLHHLECLHRGSPPVQRLQLRVPLQITPGLPFHSLLCAQRTLDDTRIASEHGDGMGPDINAARLHQKGAAVACCRKCLTDGRALTRAHSRCRGQHSLHTQHSQLVSCQMSRTQPWKMHADYAHLFEFE